MTENEMKAVRNLHERVVSLEAANKKTNEALELMVEQLLKRICSLENEIDEALGKPKRMMSEEDIARSMGASSWSPKF